MVKELIDNDLMASKEVGARVLGNLVNKNSISGTIGKTMDSAIPLNKGSKGVEACQALALVGLGER